MGRLGLGGLQLALLLGVGAGACSGNMAKSNQSETQPQAQATTVKVENQSIEDMDIYVLGAGTRVRLGMVRGNSTEVLTIPDDVVRISPQVRFLLHPIGGRNERTETISVMPGDQIQMTIPPS